jgi:hypothetical protein
VPGAVLLAGATAVAETAVDGPACAARGAASAGFAIPAPLGVGVDGASQGAVLTRADAAFAPAARSVTGRRALRRVFRSGLAGGATLPLPLPPRSAGARAVGLSAFSSRSCGGAQRRTGPSRGIVSVPGSTAGTSSRRAGSGREVSGHADPVSHVPVGRGWFQGPDAGMSAARRWWPFRPGVHSSARDRSRVGASRRARAALVRGSARGTLSAGAVHLVRSVSAPPGLCDGAGLAGAACRRGSRRESLSTAGGLRDSWAGPASPRYLIQS